MPASDEFQTRFDQAATARAKFDLAHSRFLLVVKHHHRMSQPDLEREQREIDAALTEATDHLLRLAAQLDQQMTNP